MPERYIIGAEPMPKWAQKVLQPYRKTDGTVGYEFYGKYATKELSAGDELVDNGDWIDVRRAVKLYDEGKRVFATGQKAEHHDSQ